MLKISLLSKFCLRLQLGFDKFLVRVLIVILVVVVTNENKVNPKFCLRLLLGFDKRLNDGNNNGQATHGARKHAWRTQAAWAKRYFMGCRKLFTLGGEIQGLVFVKKTVPFGLNKSLN